MPNAMIEALKPYLKQSGNGYEPNDNVRIEVLGGDQVYYFFHDGEHLIASVTSDGPNSDYEEQINRIADLKVYVQVQLKY